MIVDSPEPDDAEYVYLLLLMLLKMMAVLDYCFDFAEVALLVGFFCSVHVNVVSLVTLCLGDVR